MEPLASRPYQLKMKPASKNSQLFMGSWLHRRQKQFELPGDYSKKTQNLFSSKSTNAY